VDASSDKDGWETILLITPVYLNDIIRIRKIPSTILRQMKQVDGYILQDVVQPKSYLGADIGRITWDFGYTWSISPDTYVSKALATVEDYIH